MIHLKFINLFLFKIDKRNQYSRWKHCQDQGSLSSLHQIRDSTLTIRFRELGSSRAAIARPVQCETIVLAGSRQRVVSEITTGKLETAHPDGRPLSIPLPRPWTLRQHAPIRIRLQLSPRQCNESSTKMRRLVKHLHFLKTKMLMRHPVYFLKIT